jgi:hypothetical protein
LRVAVCGARKVKKGAWESEMPARERVCRVFVTVGRSRKSAGTVPRTSKVMDRDWR